jgi:hypothetical protein
MATQAQLNQIQMLYIGYYQRPADPEGLHYWADLLDSFGNDLHSVIDHFAYADESRQLYTGVAPQERVTQIYRALFNRDPEPEGLAYWTHQLETGATTPQLIVVHVIGAASPSDAMALSNKLEAANFYTRQVQETGTPFQGQADTAEARAYLAPVSADINTLVDAIGTVLQRTLQHQVERAAARELFDSEWYLAQYPDVAANWQGDPADHYFLHGAAEGKRPAPWFDPDFYNSFHNFADPFGDPIDPFLHYAAYGSKMGTVPSSEFVEFDANRYLSDHPELAQSGVDTSTALRHYLAHGMDEGWTIYDRDGDPIHVQEEEDAQDGNDSGLTVIEVPVYFQPTDIQQFALELINWMRANPTEAAAYCGVDLNEGLPAGTISPEPKQPLALDGRLCASAEDQLVWVINENDGRLSHDGAFTRMHEHKHDYEPGYDLLPAAQNLAAGSYDPPRGFLSDPRQPEIEELTRLFFKDTDTLSRGHRINMLSEYHQVVGIGITESDVTRSFGKDRFLFLGQDFANVISSKPGWIQGKFILGTAYGDYDGDNMYDPGEGIGGLKVKITSDELGVMYVTETNNAGGYQVFIDHQEPAHYKVEFYNSFETKLLHEEVILLGSENVKVDYID